MRSSPTPGRRAVETALKIAIAYQRAIGQGTRTRLIGRERGYHGVNFGGISVGGIVSNRKFFGTLLTGVDHLPHTHDLRAERLRQGAAGARGGAGGRAGADRGAARREHDRGGDRRAGGRVDRRADPAEGIPGAAAARSARKHGILLIFDEVITGFGRTGRGVRGGQVRRDAGHDHLRQGADQRGDPDGRGADDGRDPRRLHDRAGASDRAVPRLHLFRQPDRLRRRGWRRWRPMPRRGCSSARRRWRRTGRRRCIRCATPARHRHPQRGADRGGGAGAARRASRRKRAFQAFLDAYEAGILIRTTGDIIALSPPLIITEAQIDELIGTLRGVLTRLHDRRKRRDAAVRTRGARHASTSRRATGWHRHGLDYVITT